MSDAKVFFLTADYQPAKASNGVRFGFICPKGNKCSGLLIAGRTSLKRVPKGGSKDGAPQWDFNGNAKRPTFSPSINCKGCWHGYIRNGRCVSTNGIDEPEPVVTT